MSLVPMFSSIVYYSVTAKTETLVLRKLFPFNYDDNGAIYDENVVVVYKLGQ